jgi:hypothetical protein
MEKINNKTMTIKYTKDKLIDELMAHNKEVVKYMGNIAASLDKINDSNILHSGTINANSEVIREMVNINSSFLKLFRWIMIVLVAAIIILAGAEKALKFLPLS